VFLVRSRMGGRWGQCKPTGRPTERLTMSGSRRKIGGQRHANTVFSGDNRRLFERMNETGTGSSSRKRQLGRDLLQRVRMHSCGAACLEASRSWTAWTLVASDQA
jgi:hypothetical protein